MSPARCALLSAFVCGFYAAAMLLLYVARPKLTVVPCELREARAFVSQHHRHHKPSKGHKFSVAVADELGEVHGVAIVGRPVARHSSDGWTLEVNRVATDGCPNACSALYAAAWRAARAMGYRKLITFTLPEEGGRSLVAAGWRCIGSAGGGQLVPPRPAPGGHAPHAAEVALGGLLAC